MLIIIKINPNDTSAIGAEYKCTYKNTQSSFINFFILPFYKHRNITATTYNIAVPNNATMHSPIISDFVIVLYKDNR